MCFSGLGAIVRAPTFWFLIYLRIHTGNRSNAKTINSFSALRGPCYSVIPLCILRIHGLYQIDLTTKSNAMPTPKKSQPRIMGRFADAPPDHGDFAHTQVTRAAEGLRGLSGICFAQQ